MTTDAERLRQALRAHKISQREFAAYCGKSVSWISDICRGNYPLYQRGKVPVGVWSEAQRWLPELREQKVTP